MTLGEEIAEAEAKLAALKQRASTATCADLGHQWKHSGGRWAGCCSDCACSVPVHECERCGASDYGDPAEAEVIAGCQHRLEFEEPQP